MANDRPEVGFRGQGRGVAIQKRALAGIVERASTIRERLRDDTFEHAQPTRQDVLLTARMDDWCQAVSGGDVGRFRFRLAWDDLDLEAARRAVAPVRLRKEAPMPAWVEILTQAMTFARTHLSRRGTETPSAFLNPKDPLPFEDILAVFVRAARAKLRAEGRAGRPLLSPQAYTMLERDLLRGLVSFSAQTLYREFSILRYHDQSSRAPQRKVFEGDGDRRLYAQFVHAVCTDGLLGLFRQYPVLARLLGTISRLWVEANAEFLERLRSDLPEIQRALGNGSDLGEVIAVQPSLSDPHRGRRSVIVLTFDSGRKVVYKPKDLGIDDAYNRLLTWLNHRGCPLFFQPVKVINCSSHGWAEFVEHSPCKNREEARRYYRRAGMLLCLVHLLRGTDCHYDNVIASGEHPTLVDLETLLHPQVPWEAQSELDPVGPRLAASLLATGLLPTTQEYGPRRTAYDPSGLGSRRGQDMPYRTLRWERANTDHMLLEYNPQKSHVQSNLPTLDGVPVLVGGRATDLEEGFRQMYNFLKSNRHALQSASSPLHELGRQEVRFVYRRTRVYRVILEHSLQPKYLRDGADWSIQLELLARGVMPVSDPRRNDLEKPRFWPILEAEERALEGADIPRFTTRADSTSLELRSDQRLEDCFIGPSALPLTRLNSLDEADLERQLEFIRGSLKSHAAALGEREDGSGRENQRRAPHRDRRGARTADPQGGA